jgi:hypothetical protein
MYPHFFQEPQSTDHISLMEATCREVETLNIIRDKDGRAQRLIVKIKNFFRRNQPVQSSDPTLQDGQNIATQARRLLQRMERVQYLPEDQQDAEEQCYVLILSVQIIFT